LGEGGRGLSNICLWDHLRYVAHMGSYNTLQVSELVQETLIWHSYVRVRGLARTKRVRRGNWVAGMRRVLSSQLLYVVVQRQTEDSQLAMVLWMRTVVRACQMSSRGSDAQKVPLTR